jgi:outer membrane protein assembly factor BamE (lipoprotein component of BamABCDE complex)
VWWGAAFLVVGALASSVLCGCVMGRTYRYQPIDEQKIAQIQRGVTTRADILREFGPPQEIDAREIASVDIQDVEEVEPTAFTENQKDRVLAPRWFRYTYARGNGSGLILLVFNYGEFDQKNQTLIVFFDDNEVVEDFAYRDETTELPRFGPWSRW